MLKWAYKFWKSWYETHFTKRMFYTFTMMIFEKNLESKSVFTQDVEEDEIREWDWKQNVWDGNKTKDLLTKWIEFKDVRTSFENWNWMEGISEKLTPNP